MFLFIIVIELKAEITQFIDYNAPPGWVECRFVDAWGNEHIFIEKIPVVTIERLDENSSYPRDAFIACQIIEEKYIDGRKIIKIDTEKPWGIELANGKHCFEVLAEQLIIKD